MPGSKSDPVVLDQYQTIVEVGWPGKIVIKLYVYSVTTGVPEAGFCEPSVATAEHVGRNYITRHYFSYYSPGAEPDSEEMIRGAWKWKQYTEEELEGIEQSEHPNRDGQWESMSGNFTVENEPPDQHGDTSFASWQYFTAVIRWTDLPDGDDESKYYVPDQPVETADIFFNMMDGVTFQFRSAAIPMGAGPLCYVGPGSSGVLASQIANPSLDASYIDLQPTTYDFSKTIFTFQTDRTNEDGETIFEHYKPTGIQVTPKPRPLVGGSVPEGLTYDVQQGPATIFLLCSRKGGAARVVEEESD